MRVLFGIVSAFYTGRRVYVVGVLQGLEGSSALLQLRVKSAFFKLVHAFSATLERCLTSTGDVSLAQVVMWNAAIDYEVCLCVRACV